jgi:predicted nucleic acid-binding protein
MVVFFDTSVLVAAAVRSHEHHAGAFAAVQRAVSGKDRGCVAAHGLAELYAVLTRLPVSPRIRPDEAARIVTGNVLRALHVEALGARDYGAVVEAAARDGVSGGAIYDAILLACAEKSKVDRIYTFNVGDFRRLAPHLSRAIMAP